MGISSVIYVLPLLAIVTVFVVTLGGRKLKEEEGRALKLLGLGAVLLLAPEWLSQPFAALALIVGALLLTALLVSLRRLTSPPGAGSAAR